MAIHAEHYTPSLFLILTWSLGEFYKLCIYTVEGQTAKHFLCIHHPQCLVDLSSFLCIAIPCFTSESVLIINVFFIRIAVIALSETAVDIEKALIIMGNILMGLIKRTCFFDTTINKQKKP